MNVISRYFLMHCNIIFSSELFPSLFMIVTDSDSKVVVIERGISTTRSSSSILCMNFDCENLKSGISFDIAAEEFLTVSCLIFASPSVFKF